jgi:hypothetical protein
MSILCLRLHFGQLCVREVLLLGRGISVSKRMALCTWNIVCDCKLVNVCAVNPVKKIVRKTLGAMQAVPVLSHASVQQGRESNPNSQLSSKHPRGSKRHLACASKKYIDVHRSLTGGLNGVVHSSKMCHVGLAESQKPLGPDSKVASACQCQRAMHQSKTNTLTLLCDIMWPSDPKQTPNMI